MIKPIILASQSPRRKELFSDCGYPFQIICANIEEHLDHNIPMTQAITQLAYQKAEAVFQANPEAIVIGCDTMVIFEDKPLGKPKNKEEAYQMLRALANNTHTVISGVAILSKEENILFHETTEVVFYDIDEKLLEAYLNTEEAYDKAGGYGIQGTGKLFVKEIHGDYYNVMGLPIAKVYRELQKLLKK